MSAWDALTREFDLWSQAGKTADFWWRDDDAYQPTPALDRLANTARGAPIGLAVVPAKVVDALSQPIDKYNNISILQHGYSHQNYASPADHKIELGPQRPLVHTLGDLATGWARLEAIFGTRALPVLVPPWNRLAPGLVPLLPEIGYRGLSTYGARSRPEPIPNLAQVNTHVDIIDWRGSRGFLGDEAVLGRTVDFLARRRTAQIDADEPTGILTHHLVHDDACWAFLTRLVAAIESHAATRWRLPADLFRPRPVAPRRAQPTEKHA